MSDRIKVVIPEPIKELTFRLEPNQDEQLTCVVCGHSRCSLGFMTHSKRSGKRSWYGVHEQCWQDWFIGEMCKSYLATNG